MAGEETPSGRADDDEGLSLDKRKALLGLIIAALLAAGAFTGIGELAQFGRLSAAIARLDKVWLPACVLGQLLAYLGYVLAYRDAAGADGGPRFNFGTTTRIVVFGIGTSVFAASVGGLAVDFWALRRTGTRTHVAVRRVLAIGTIEWTILSLYAVAAAIAVLAAGGDAPAGMALAWLVAVPGCVAGALWFTAPRRVGRFTSLPRREVPAGIAGPHRVLTLVGVKLRQGLADAISGVVFVRHLLAHPVRYHGAAIGYPIYWAGDMLTLYASLRGLGVQLGLAPLILAYATSFVISALPLPAGGVGGVEAGMAFALHAVGAPLAAGLLAVFIYRVFTFWLPVIPTLLLIPSMRRLHRQLPRVPHTPRDPDEYVSFRPASDAPA